MSDVFSTALVTLPLGAIIGWFANRLLAPTFDEFGSRLKIWVMSHVSKDEFSTYFFYSNLHGLISELHHKYGHSRFNTQKPYLHDHNINLGTKRKSEKQLRDIASVWIQETPIESYNEGDVFFAGLELLLPYLTKGNIESIFEKHKENSQAALWVFLEMVEDSRPDLLKTNVLQYLRTKQKDWSGAQIATEVS